MCYLGHPNLSAKTNPGIYGTSFVPVQVANFLNKKALQKHNRSVEFNIALEPKECATWFLCYSSPFLIKYKIQYTYIALGAIWFNCGYEIGTKGTTNWPNHFIGPGSFFVGIENFCLDACNPSNYNTGTAKARTQLPKPKILWWHWWQYRLWWVPYY